MCIKRVFIWKGAGEGRGYYVHDPYLNALSCHKPRHSLSILMTLLLKCREYKFITCYVCFKTIVGMDSF